MIDNYVLDVTNYMDKHPGGDVVISELGGKDASDAFNKPGRHSAAAMARMKSLRFGFIGDEAKLIP